MQARSQDNSEASESLPVSDGVKQGCVLAQTLFRLLVFSAMLTDAFRDRDVEWESDIEQMASASTSGGFRKKKKTKVMTDIIRDFLFADDFALISVSQADE